MSADDPSAEPDALAVFEALIPGDPERAAKELRELLGRDPLNAAGYRLLVRALAQLDGAAIRTTVRAADPTLERAWTALNSDDLETAEILLRRRLLERPNDAPALHLMARVAATLNFSLEAEALLRLALEIDPGFLPAIYDLAAALHVGHRSGEAIELVERILEREPENESALTLKAAALFRIGEFAKAVSLAEQLLERSPDDAVLWSTYGHYLKTLGRSEEGEKAMRRAVEIAPGHGELWWNLANMKTAKFTGADVAVISGALAASRSDKDSTHLHFALGKAFEDLGDNAEAFGAYSRANAIWKRSLNHDPGEVTREVTAASAFFTKSFFDDRAGFGSASNEPIFIVGMTRSGSTLVEQILASHSQIEGTMELPYVGLIARQFGRRKDDYHARLASLSAEQLKAAGEEYLSLAASHRVEGKPHFIDKMPNNWLHVPLIQLMLPNARIIDARRHPLACGVSNFRQHYARGQQFTYDLNWFGRFYYDYVRMMAHVDEALPGRVHRVIYENLVADTEAEVRRLLDYLGVPFEESCLRFYEQKRAVHTPSSEQVRRPITAEKVEGWRAYEPWLGDLKDALGPVLDAYPAVPDFDG